jgi:alginate O-acetyltransferase complex protein AlgI
MTTVLTPGTTVSAVLPDTDPRVARATTNPVRFLVLAGQLALLLVVFRVYHVEDPAFLLLAGVAFAGFGIHYWLPFYLKQPFWLVLSLGGAYVLLEPLTATLLLAVGMGFYGLLASPFSFRTRLAAFLAVSGVLVYARATQGLGIPYQFWPVFGAIFMFRMMIYLYDLAHAAERPKFTDYLAYFFVLPNYYFLLFPVIDFQTMRRSWYQRDIHVVAQQGILWMTRGAVHLMLYRLIYHVKGPSNAPEAITSFGSLAAMMVMTYLLYLRVSGQFHIIVGMMHLFGYDLPETHRKFLLASSLTDFWRRINIYWKDFMVKMVYFPVYFRMRRSGEMRAQVVATGAVFTATWLLHSYQWFWLRGDWLFTWPDFTFWAVLGVLVTLNLIVEARRTPGRRLTGWQARAVKGLQIAGTFSLIVVLWSMWNSPSLAEWYDVLTWWQIG